MAYHTYMTPVNWIFKSSLLIWQFTESDFATFLGPDTAFGIFGAVRGGRLSSGIPPSLAEILWRLPLVVVYNWANLLCFNIANQWEPRSVEEDRLNKPWRPLPMGNITSQQARHAVLALVPATLWLNYCLGVYAQGTVIHVIIWLYNGLGGSDEPFVREILISAGYAMFNGGSLQIALGREAHINSNGVIWTAVISGVIVTTMQIQDLKDLAGDRLRQRKTLPLYLGEEVSPAGLEI
ncbi:uncharacterized protein PG986_013810 [Apiospora aurea]|uniref:Uncharacterized protein n=1 Tax=Apiospora aurea TaxID=335848 RepID=A0ABR1PWY9_9PEZI